MSSSGGGLGEALFNRILESESGMVMSEHLEEESWSMIRHEGHRVHLGVDEMLEELQGLTDEPGSVGSEFPLILMAGERRSYNANTIFRNPEWRRKDVHGAVKVHPQDAVAFGLEEGDAIRLETSRGGLNATVTITDEMLPGVVSTPHGYGLDYPDGAGSRPRSGPLINELTVSDHCDPLTKTPYHKTVPVRIVPA